MGDADAEVVDAPAVAQGEFAELIDGVVADAQVCGGLACGGCFGSGGVGVRGCGRWGVGAVDALGVVELGEGAPFLR